MNDQRPAFRTLARVLEAQRDLRTLKQRLATIAALKHLHALTTNYPKTQWLADEARRALVSLQRGSTAGARRIIEPIISDLIHLS